MTLITEVKIGGVSHSTCKEDPDVQVTLPILQTPLLQILAAMKHGGGLLFGFGVLAIMIRIGLWGYILL